MQNRNDLLGLYFPKQPHLFCSLLSHCEENSVIFVKTLFVPWNGLNVEYCHCFVLASPGETVKLSFLERFEEPGSEAVLRSRSRGSPSRCLSLCRMTAEVVLK